VVCFPGKECLDDSRTVECEENREPDDAQCKSARYDPEKALVRSHVTYIAGVHAEET
jgi:hypothetical protein